MKNKLIVFTKDDLKELKQAASDGWTAGGAKEIIEVIKEEKLLKRELVESRKNYYASLITANKRFCEFYKDIGDEAEVKCIEKNIKGLEREMNEPESIKNLKAIREIFKDVFKILTRQE